MLNNLPRIPLTVRVGAGTAKLGIGTRVKVSFAIPVLNGCVHVTLSIILTRV